jgi:hypothetical protein
VITQEPQADSSIHEDQLLDFLVNALTGAFGVSIAGNGDINTLLREYTLELLPEQNALSVRREVPANKPPDDRFTR